MRTTPLIGTKPWFGPRKFGWGLEPVSPEGWLLTAVVVGAGFAEKGHDERRVYTRPISILSVAVIFLKGTSPGGPKARREFERTRR